jgi:hypothetical protein
MFHALAKLVPENESDTKPVQRIASTRNTAWSTYCAGTHAATRTAQLNLSSCSLQKTRGCANLARCTVDLHDIRLRGSAFLHDMRDMVLLIMLRECVPKLRFDAQPADTGHPRIPQCRLFTSKRYCGMMFQGSRSGRTSLCARHESLCTGLLSWTAWA